MPDRIVSIGECMVELAPKPGGDYQMGFAGDTLNTAWYLRRALPDSYQVDYFTCVGTDPISDRMLAFLEAGGIGTGHIARLEDRTVGLYLIQNEGGERSFAYWRSVSAAKTLAADPARLDAALSGARLAYVSGITLAILPENDRPTLLAALDRARARGTMVAFDSNLRPRLFPNIAAMRGTVAEAARHADILLPSFEDEAAYFGDPSPEATARRYAGMGAELVVVKNGGKEIIAIEEGRLSRHQPVPAPKIVDTTAAGDSFNAALLAGRLTGRSLAESIAGGAWLAAQVIGAPGALVET